MKRLTICILLYSVVCNGQGTKRPSVLGNAHMAIYVSDLARARVFYEDFLGYAEPYSLKNKEGDATRIAFVKINEDQYLELFAEKSREAGLQLNHISFQTSDAEALRRYLASRGIKVPDLVGKGLWSANNPSIS